MDRLGPKNYSSTYLSCDGDKYPMLASSLYMHTYMQVFLGMDMPVIHPRAKGWGKIADTKLLIG